MLTYPLRLELKYKPVKDMIVADGLSMTFPHGMEVNDDLGSDPLLQVCQLVIRTDDTMAKYSEASRADEELLVVLKYQNRLA